MRMFCDKALADLTYRDVVNVLMELVEDEEWVLVDEAPHPLRIIRQEDNQSMDLMRALYFYFVGEDIGSRNAHQLLVEEQGFDDTLYTIFCHAAEHREHGRYHELMLAMGRPSLAA